MRILACLGATAAFATFLPAQHTILLTADTTQNTLGLDAPELDLIRTSEIYEVTPTTAGAYTARPFLPISLQWIYVGDLDNDSQYVEASTDGPGDKLDVVFVKAGPGPVTPRDVFWSIDSAASINIPGLLVSDVVRYSGQGVRETFVSHAVLQAAVGGPATMNLDALAQSATGDLFLSVGGTSITTVLGATLDGDLLMIPASAITYDPVTSNVTAITPGSVVRVATEAHLIAMANASGFRTSVGGQVTTSFDLSGLELDPNGGAFVSPVDGVTVLPNLVYCWSDSTNDGAIISTNAGGTIAVINGVAMGSTVGTQSDQIGWQPDSTGAFGPGGLAIIPQQAPAYAMLNYPRNLHTGGQTGGTGTTLLQLQVSGGTPGGASVLAIHVETSTPGGTFPSVPSPSPFLGELSAISPIVLGIYLHDGLGNTNSEFFVLSTPPLSGLDMVTQALDLTTLRLSTPGALSFL